MNWEDEFKYLLHRKILSGSEFQELIEQITSIIYREVSPLKKQIEEYQTATGWAKVIELEQKIKRIESAKVLIGEVTLEDMNNLEIEFDTPNKVILFTCPKNFYPDLKQGDMVRILIRNNLNFWGDKNIEALRKE
jgi:hypothetical protein